MQYFNLHTHSFYSDGSDDPHAYVKEAIRQNFDLIGFTEHSPLPFKNNFSILEEQLTDYRNHIINLKEQYKDEIEVLLSMEFDYIPGISHCFIGMINKLELDYHIGSVHLVKNDDHENLWFIDGPKRESYDKGLEKIFNNDIRKAVEAYFHQLIMMIEFEKPDIIGHMDKIKMHNQDRYFSEDETWYQALLDKTLRLIADAGIILEVNTRGIYKKRCNALFPSPEVLKKSLKMDIPITLTSDAHQPAEISQYFPESLKILHDIGYKKLSIYKNNAWQSRKISSLIDK